MTRRDRREYPHVNDAVIERQRRTAKPGLAPTEPSPPNAEPPPPPTPSSGNDWSDYGPDRGHLHVDLRPLVASLDRGKRARVLAHLERQLIAAYTAPAESDESFLNAARQLAEALIALRAPDDSTIVPDQQTSSARG